MKRHHFSLQTRSGPAWAILFAFLWSVLWIPASLAAAEPPPSAPESALSEPAAPAEEPKAEVIGNTEESQEDEPGSPPPEPAPEASPTEERTGPGKESASAEKETSDNEESAGKAAVPAKTNWIRKLKKGKRLDVDELKSRIRGRRKSKHSRNQYRKDANIVDRLVQVQGKQRKTGFDLDYAPSEDNVFKPEVERKKKKKSTPFYKHWAFWTAIGVAAFSGVLIYVKYGVDNDKTMSLDVERRN